MKNKKINRKLRRRLIYLSKLYCQEDLLYNYHSCFKQFLGIKAYVHKTKIMDFPIMLYKICNDLDIEDYRGKTTAELIELIRDKNEVIGKKLSAHYYKYIAK